MTRSSLLHGLDGLMTLSRREGVDIKPTLLRVLTDLYVQESVHSADEERQFIELTSRLIDQVDDTTRAAVRARLAIYPSTPIEILQKLGLRLPWQGPPLPQAGEIPAALQPPPRPQQTDDERRDQSSLSMQPKDATELCEMFFRASPHERATMLQSLTYAPLKPAVRLPQKDAARAIGALEMAAFISDRETFTTELSDSLLLPLHLAERVVDDISGEALACAAKALGMPGPVFERVLLFLKPEIGQSVHIVFRLSRLYARLGERPALIMLAAWRGAAGAALRERAKYRPVLYDDERQRARAPSRGTAQPATSAPLRTGTDGFER